jgi:hypothetical protein
MEKKSEDNVHHLREQLETVQLKSIELLGKFQGDDEEQLLVPQSLDTFFHKTKTLHTKLDELGRCLNQVNTVFQAQFNPWLVHSSTSPATSISQTSTTDAAITNVYHLLRKLHNRLTHLSQLRRDYEAILSLPEESLDAIANSPLCDEKVLRKLATQNQILSKALERRLR